MHTVKWFQVFNNSHNINISHLFAHIVCSIWPIDSAQLGVTTPGQSGSGSNGNEGVLHIPQISKAGASPSDDLLSYPEHLLGGGSLTPQQRCRRCILQPLPTGPINNKELSLPSYSSINREKTDGFMPFPKALT